MSSQKTPLPYPSPVPPGAASDPFGPHPTPSFGTPAMLSDVRKERNLTQQQIDQTEHTAKVTAWRAGVVAGLAGVVAAVGVAFLVFFKNEERTQEKVNESASRVEERTDRKFAEMKSDVKVLQFQGVETSKKLDTIAAGQEDLMKEVRRLARDRRERDGR